MTQCVVPCGTLGRVAVSLPGCRVAVAAQGRVASRPRRVASRVGYRSARYALALAENAARVTRAHAREWIACVYARETPPTIVLRL